MPPMYNGLRLAASAMMRATFVSIPKAGSIPRRTRDAPDLSDRPARVESCPRPPSSRRNRSASTALFEELAELTGQRNAIDGRIVEIVAEMERDGLRGVTGARSAAHLAAWKTGVSPSRAETIAAVADRLEQFPQCVAGLREGRLSLDQVGVIAQRAADGSDAHYAELAASATVASCAPRSNSHPNPTRTRDPRTRVRGGTRARAGPHDRPTTVRRAVHVLADPAARTWRRRRSTRRCSPTVTR